MKRKTIFIFIIHIYCNIVKNILFSQGFAVRPPRRSGVGFICGRAVDFVLISGERF